jgi:hypothetical protein
VNADEARAKSEANRPKIVALATLETIGHIHNEIDGQADSRVCKQVSCDGQWDADVKAVLEHFRAQGFMISYDSSRFFPYDVSWYPKEPEAQAECEQPRVGFWARIKSKLKGRTK